ncbi:alcohol dehydrogenase [Flavobacterium akiainvivens]|uniref:Alcohol dehydrogenase n=2 Tax=Flavobacterium akiainvivens TaxID=1202724 RepID=A0A0M9VHA2_9FLAO|nr:alcohol dehydrogenase [Flavobacterium akiainvivens]
MKAWQLQGFGMDNLKSITTEIPTPAKNEILVKVGAVSLNFRDKAIIDQIYLPEIMQFPFTPVSDLAGEVLAIGSEVARFNIGDRVTSHLYGSWIKGKKHTSQTALSGLGGPVNGGLAEYVLLDEQAAVITPSTLTDEEAATLPIAALTAFFALTEHGGLEKGQTVLVQGTGGVSIFALQLAKALGAKVIVTSSSDEKLAKAKALGADEVINYIKTPEWDKEALRLTGGAGVDHILEVVGGENFERSVEAAAIGGQIHVIGFLNGTHSNAAMLTILFKGVRINGILVGNRNAFEQMNLLIQEHNIKPVIDTVYDFENAKEAYKHIERGAFGKLVIKVS